MNRLWNARGMRGGISVLVALAVLMVVVATPARGLADGVLGRFRVQKFAAVTIPMDVVQQLQSGVGNLSDTDKQALKQQFDKLGTFNTTLGMQSARQVASIDEARAQYGNLNVPGQLPAGFDVAPTVYVSDAGTASYTLNTAEAQGLIDRLGLPIYSLPDAAQYPSLTFNLNVPKAAVLDYQNAAGQRLLVGQMASPTLTTPDGVDMNLLREDLLGLPGLPTDLVAQLRAIDNWQNTLIIPVPQGARTDDITMNGEPALYIEGGNGEGSVVLWQKGGVLYVVAGQVSRDALLATADALQ